MLHRAQVCRQAATTPDSLCFLRTDHVLWKKGASVFALHLLCTNCCQVCLPTNATYCVCGKEAVCSKAACPAVTSRATQQQDPLERQSAGCLQGAHCWQNMDGAVMTPKLCNLLRTSSMLQALI